MNLGKHVQITIGVPDVAVSAEFFQSLNFRLIDQADKPYPWAQFSDGQNLILLNQDGMIYRGLNYFNPALDTLVPQMEAVGVTFFWKQTNDDGSLASAMFIDPNGSYGEDKNLGINIVAKDGKDLHQPEGVPLTLCGKFGEICSSTSDYAAAATFWGKLGYSVWHAGEEPYSYGILQDGSILLGYHQTPADMLIPSPALTYFSADSAERISHIKALGHQPSFENRDATGVISEAGFISPGGQHFYIFNGEI